MPRCSMPPNKRVWKRNTDYDEKYRDLSQMVAPDFYFFVSSERKKDMLGKKEEETESPNGKDIKKRLILKWRGG